MMTLTSAGVFVVRYPEHPITAKLSAVVARILAQVGARPDALSTASQSQRIVAIRHLARAKMPATKDISAQGPQDTRLVN